MNSMPFMELGQIGNVMYFLLMGYFIVIGYKVFKLVYKPQPKPSDFIIENNNNKKLDVQYKMTFDDVAGCDEAKRVLTELIQHIKNPSVSMNSRIKCQNGILLVGPPATGKTLLARAVADLAGCTFFSCSGTDVVTASMGMNDNFIKKLFKEARQRKPSIIFIDEIDAMCSTEKFGPGTASVRQLLVELDGFSKIQKPGVFNPRLEDEVYVLAATNKLDSLDSALIRVGRFDSIIHIKLPDLLTREKILTLHAKSHHFSPLINWKDYASMSSGCNGADLAKFVNEAIKASFKAREDWSESGPGISLQVVDKTFQESILGVGPNRLAFGRQIKERIAIHEAGHAVLFHHLNDVKESRLIKLSILGNENIGGFMQIIPNLDATHLQTKSQLKNLIIIGFGGMVAEQLFLQEISSGASSDLEQATTIAQKMVRDYGMTGLYSAKEKSSSTKKVNKHIEKLLSECKKIALSILQDKKEMVQLLADELIKKEVLTENEILSIVEK